MAPLAILLVVFLTVQGVASQRGPRGGMGGGGQQQQGGAGGGQQQQGGGGAPGGMGQRQSSGTACPAGDGVTTKVYTSGSMWAVLTSSCPQYDPSGQSTGNTPTDQQRLVKFPRSPVLSTDKIYVGRYAEGSTLNTHEIMGPIGIAKNGVFIYNDANAQGADVLQFESQSLDKCLGHADQSGTYHYHTAPPAGCVYDAPAGQHSPLFGVMMDGIPIYGPDGDGGAAPSLDECGGHTDTTHPFYHYHVTRNLADPYTIKCLRGCVLSAWGQQAQGVATTDATCNRAAAQYDYPSLLTIDWLHATMGGELTAQQEQALTQQSQTQGGGMQQQQGGGQQQQQGGQQQQQQQGGGQQQQGGGQQQQFGGGQQQQFGGGQQQQFGGGQQQQFGGQGQQQQFGGQQGQQQGSGLRSGPLAKPPKQGPGMGRRMKQ